VLLSRWLETGLDFNCGDMSSSGHNNSAADHSRLWHWRGSLERQMWHKPSNLWWLIILC
jgi:hypothetical protein